MDSEAKAAGLTINVAGEALTDPDVTPMEVVPWAAAVANPAVPVATLIVATFKLLEVQCPVVVRSCVVPSVKVPVAVNCWVVPTGVVAVGGLIAIETSAAAVTVRSVEPLTVPEVAVIVAVPIPALCARPALIVATEFASVAQVTVEVKSCVLPSVKVPVAVNCWLVPRAMEGLAGETAMEVSAAAEIVNLVDPVIDPDVAVIVAEPSLFAVARPAVVGSLLMLAIDGVSELH